MKMQKNYYVVAVTGAACGGKTSGMAAIADHFQSLGFRVFIVSEAATRAMEGRMTIEQCQLLPFQRHLVRAALSDEINIRKLAAEVGTLERPALALLDRTFHDCRAFMEEQDWFRAANECGALELAPLAGYDATVHLASTAVGRPDLFRLLRENNPVRLETEPEEVVAQDKRLEAAYHGAENWVFCGNEGSFAEKIQRAVEGVCAAIGTPKPLWFQRKFLVQSFDPELLKAARPTDIEVTEYLLDSVRFRRRRVLEDGSESYARVKKTLIDDGSGGSIKIVTPVDRPTFYGGWQQVRSAGQAAFTRVRHSLTHGGVRVVFDEFQHPAGWRYFEAHVAKAGDTFEVPPWIRLGNDVTCDAKHSIDHLLRPQPR